MSRLRKDEILTASVDVRSSADEVYAVIADVSRIPEWSPETARVERLGSDRFRAWNKRRLARWRTDSRIVTEEPGKQFSFIVQTMGADWTQWTYTVEPGSTADTVRLTEEFRMCVDLPVGILVYEHLFLFVRDRRSDLQTNLDSSVARIRDIVEAQARRGTEAAS